MLTILNALRMAALTAAVLIAAVSGVNAEEFTYVPEETRAGLEPSDATRLDTLLVSPDADFSRYDSIHIAPVVFALSKEVRIGQLRLVELPENDRAYLEKTLRRAFENRFNDGLRIVEEPGEQTLTIQVALTDLLPNRDRRGIVSRDGRREVGQRIIITIGRATMEAVLTDAASGEVVAVALDSFRGRTLDDVARRQFRWGDVREAFRIWSREFRKLF